MFILLRARTRYGALGACLSSRHNLTAREDSLLTTLILVMLLDRSFDMNLTADNYLSHCIRPSGSLPHKMPTTVIHKSVDCSGAPLGIKAATTFQRKHKVNLIADLVENSYEKGEIKQSPLFDEMTEKLHSFMFVSVYTNPQAKGEEKKATRMLEMLFEYYMDHPEDMPDFYRSLLDSYPRDRVVGDYIASFTDRYAIRMFENLFVPKTWNT